LVFRDVVHVVTCGSECFDDGSVYSFVAKEVQAASSGIGYTTSARSTSAANANAA
jgi:hypothetical protein